MNIKEPVEKNSSSFKKLIHTLRRMIVDHPDCQDADCTDALKHGWAQVAKPMLQDLRDGKKPSSGNLGMFTPDILLGIDWYYGLDREEQKEVFDHFDKQASHKQLCRTRSKARKQAASV